MTEALPLRDKLIATYPPDKNEPGPWLPQCLLAECYVYRINPKLGGVERAACGLTEAMARRIAEMLNSREELA